MNRFAALSILALGTLFLILGATRMAAARYLNGGSTCQGFVDSILDEKTGLWVAMGIHCPYNASCVPPPGAASGTCVEITVESGPGWAYKTCGCLFFNEDGDPLFEIWEMTVDNFGMPVVACDAKALHNDEGFDDAWCTRWCPGLEECEQVFVDGGPAIGGTFWKRERCTCP